jgi:hypothetical protein
MKGPLPDDQRRRYPSSGWEVPMAVAPSIVSDGLRERIEPLPPMRQWRFRYPRTVTNWDKLSVAVRQTM